MSPDEQAERQFLLRSAQKGNKAAFEKLITPHLSKLYNLAYHLVQHRDDAADAVQDTVIKAFRSIHGFREEADLGTWLSRILRNTILDEVKRAVRRHEEATEVLPERGEHITEPGMEKRELRDLMLGFINELSDKLREPVVLYDLEGFSYEEIAEILDINIGTVKSRLSRGRMALREKILAQPEKLSGYLPPQLAESLTREAN